MTNRSGDINIVARKASIAALDKFIGEASENEQSEPSREEARSAMLDAWLEAGAEADEFDRQWRGFSVEASNRLAKYDTASNLREKSREAIRRSYQSRI